MTRPSVPTLLLTVLLGAAGCDGPAPAERLDTWLHRHGLYVSAEPAAPSARLADDARGAPHPWPAV